MVKLQECFNHKLTEVKRQHETALAELKLSNTQELARVTSEHSATVHDLEASHARQVTALKLDHSEELLKQKEDLEAQHAGMCSLPVGCSNQMCRVCRTNFVYETACKGVCTGNRQS